MTANTTGGARELTAVERYLGDGTQLKPGVGEKLPPLYDTSRAEKLEEEAARLRKTIDEQQARLRKSMFEWEQGERECDLADLRYKLAEEHLKKVSGDDDEEKKRF